MQTVQTRAASTLGAGSDLVVALSDLSDAIVVDSSRGTARGLILCGCGDPVCACCS